MNRKYPRVRILRDMKAKLGLGLLCVGLVLLAGIATAPGNDTRASAPAHVDPARSIRIGLLGLKQDRIERARAAILSVPGVESVEFLPEKREARVRFNVERTNMRQLEQRIRKAGFTPWFH